MVYGTIKPSIRGISKVSDFRTLSEVMFASPQISLADLETARDQGIRLVVCNRPDDEEPGQLNVAEVEAAAADLGIDFVHIPITHAGFSEAQVS